MSSKTCDHSRAWCPSTSTMSSPATKPAYCAGLSWTTCPTLARKPVSPIRPVTKNSTMASKKFARGPANTTQARW